jgi:hypothetical protein|nr:MAG TPA: homing endonuclease [Caudoviricetes sp.]
MDNYIGRRYDMLECISEPYRKDGRLVIDVRCDCGTIKTMRLDYLNKPTVRKSCGCFKYQKHLLPNNYIVHGDKVFVHLHSSQGDKSWMTCDLEDWEQAKDYNWSDRSKYARATISGNDYPFHRLYPQEDGKMIDHIDQNRYNNMKSNLRYVTRAQNAYNSNSVQSNTGIRGVSKRRDKYGAIITVNGKFISERYDTLEEAIIARKALEEKYYGLRSLETIENLGIKADIDRLIKPRS